MPPIERRPRYRPSGRFHPQRLLMAALVLTALSLAIALWLALWLAFAWHFLVISAVFPIFALGWIVHRTVERAHLRNPPLAMTLAACCAAAAYLGFFHLDHCLRWGASPLAVHNLPQYIAFRMETDQWRWHGKGATLEPVQPAPGIVPLRPLAAAKMASLNWSVFAIELMLLAGVAGGTAFATARRPYSEHRGTWLDAAQLTLAPEASNTLKQALRERSLTDWAAAGPRLVGEHESHTKVFLWYVPGGAGDDIDADACIAIGEGPGELLELDEIAALIPLFPGLQEIAASQDELAREAEATNEPTGARIWKVPPPYAGPVDNPRCRFRWRLIVRSMQLAPLLIAPGLLAAGVGIGYLLTEVMGLLPSWFVVVTVIASAAASLLLVRYWYDPHRPLWMVFGRRYNQRLLLAAIASRPDPLVAAAEPDAITAEMCPRRLWLAGGNSRCGESNLGLMLLDHVRRVLIFEGDYERYWIPAAAILYARIERIPIGEPTTASFYGVVLQVRLASRAWELPLFPLEGVPGNNRWEQAGMLLGRIEELCQRSFAGEQSSPPEPAPAGAHAG